MEIYDTLSSSLKRLEPVKGKRVNMFVCGPTVYDSPHMGHARTYIFFDVLARYLRHKGFRLFYLLNITDMEDHIIDRSKETGKSWIEITSENSKEFFKIMELLKNTAVNHYAFATDYIPEIIAQISVLVSKGYAYETPSGVYFRVRKFAEYGKLSHQKIDSLISGIRVDVDEEKEDPLDFVLWKKKKEGEPFWKSPWGDGRPGWHIEDTAITNSLFGPSYDIHGGATDLIFPHHESEIAQMETASGIQPMVSYWIHTGHLNVENIKMSKSLKNFVTIKEVLKRYWPEALRIMMLSTHYRGGVNFEEKPLKDSQTLAEKISILKHRVKGSEPRNTKEAIDTVERILEPFEADMNSPEVLAGVSEFVKSSLSIPKVDEGKKGEINYVLQVLEDVMGIVRDTPFPEKSLVLLLKMRNEMRKRGDYASADSIRDELKNYGVKIEDTGEESYLWW